ncbi:hypothetical protein [Geotalea toluenoxydans]|uniref:hypothetical protein n=1 Tax=Geotalea toluenoxydans TaxID=421624 RepID=UPI000AEEA90E|nr:hypothetical protein [Geotalea toluenoxydans]
MQKKRAKSDGSYRSEVAIGAEFQKEEFCFRVDGRMDGLFDTEPPKIEEIKSTFNLSELARRLTISRWTIPTACSCSVTAIFTGSDKGLPLSYPFIWSLPAAPTHLICRCNWILLSMNSGWRKDLTNWSGKHGWLKNGQPGGER